MAKRSRGSTRRSQRRPGRRSNRSAPPSAARPNQLSSPTRPNEIGAGVSTPGLTGDEEARAAELEAQILEEEEEEAAERRPRGSRDRVGSAEDRRAVTRERSRGGLAVRYADEYSYVARDLRRIAVVAVILVAILFGLFALQLAGVLSV